MTETLTLHIISKSNLRSVRRAVRPCLTEHAYNILVLHIAPRLASLSDLKHTKGRELQQLQLPNAHVYALCRWWRG